MDPVVDTLTALGGVATRAALIDTTCRAAVDRAVRAGQVLTVAPGRYALPHVDSARMRAHALSGVLSLTSAALHHGWAVRTVPDEPHVTVPRNRNVAAARRAGVQLHYQDLLPEDVVEGIATSKIATLRDCLRLLPFAEALAVADSALRDGERSALALAVASIHGPGRPQARRIAAEARGEAANAFESSLRAIALDIAGLQVEPQVLIRETDPWCRPDLVDRDRRIVLEADSFEWHGSRGALARDARRYNLLVAAGWLVLRFTWEDVMFDPAYVAAVLRAVVAQRAEVGRRRRPAA